MSTCLACPVRATRLPEPPPVCWGPQSGLWREGRVSCLHACMLVWAPCEVVHPGRCGVMVRCSGIALDARLPGGVDPPAAVPLGPVRPQALACPSHLRFITLDVTRHLPLPSPWLTVENPGRCKSVHKWKLGLVANPSCPRRRLHAIPLHLTDSSIWCKPRVLPKPASGTLAQRREPDLHVV